jgi:hypothetical protein
MLTDNNILSNLSRLNTDVNLRVQKGVRRVVRCVTTLMNLRINNQKDASSTKILFCHETLYISGIYCAHHQELSAVYVAIGMFHAGYVAAA